MLRSSYCLIVFVLGIGLSSSPVMAQTLNSLRHETRTESPSSSNSGSKDHDHDNDHDHGYRSSHGPGSDALAALVSYTLLTPFWGPMTLLDDDYRSDPLFLEYPYQHGQEGSLSYWTRNADSENGAMGKWWKGQLRTDYVNDFNDLQTIGGQLILETQSRFGIDTEMKYRHESLGTGMTDQLWTGDANFVFRFAQSENMEMRSGIGFNWMSDQLGSDFGFNFTYGFDWFVADPWVVSSEIDLGTLGEATLFHNRTTVGLQFHRAEVYTGFDYYNLEGTQINGLIAGVRLWF